MKSLVLVENSQRSHGVTLMEETRGNRESRRERERQREIERDKYI